MRHRIGSCVQSAVLSNPLWPAQISHRDEPNVRVRLQGPAAPVQVDLHVQVRVPEGS